MNFDIRTFDKQLSREAVYSGRMVNRNMNGVRFVRVYDMSDPVMHSTVLYQFGYPWPFGHPHCPVTGQCIMGVLLICDNIVSMQMKAEVTQLARFGPGDKPKRYFGCGDSALEDLIMMIDSDDHVLTLLDEITKVIVNYEK